MSNNFPLYPLTNHFIGRVVNNNSSVNEYGFTLITSTKESLTKIEVISISEEFDNTLNLKIGDIVTLPKRGATEISVNGVKYHLCEKSDIIGIN